MQDDRAKIEATITAVCGAANPFKSALSALIYNQGDIARATGLPSATVSALVGGKAKATKAQLAALKWAIVARLASIHI